MVMLTFNYKGPSPTLQAIYVSKYVRWYWIAINIILYRT